MKDSGFGEPTEQSWKYVRDYIDALEIFPSSFTSCVRSLITNENQNLKNGERGINPACRSVLIRLMYSPSLTSMIYFGTRTFKFDLCPEDKVFEPEELLRLYQPGEMAALLSVIYIYRSMRRLCNRDEWEKYNSTIIKSIEISGLLGRMIPAIGLSRGMFAGAYPRFGLCTLMVGNLKGFKDYRGVLREKKRVADLDLETEIFGCDSAQIGSRMLQLFGFGAEIAKECYFGISETGDARERRDDVVAFTVCNRWVASLLERGEAPQEALGDEFEVDDLNLDIFFPRIKGVLQDGSRHKWLERKAEDLDGRVLVREAGGPVSVIRSSNDSAPEEASDPVQEEASEKKESLEQGSETPNPEDVFGQEELDSLYSSVQDLLDPSS